MGFKKGWRAFKAAKRGRKSSTSPRRRSVTRRRTPSNPRRRTMARRKMITPHPSITGMAAGFSLVDDLNKGDVVGQLLKGSLTGAINTLSANSQALIKTDPGRKALVQAVGIAAIGAWARKALPATKIGGSKFYFKI
jgi:hypothetical protein